MKSTSAFVVGLCALAGCYAPDVPNGALRCSDDGRCPRGFYCEGTTLKCFRDGTGPGDVDLSGMADMSDADLTIVKVGIGVPCTADNQCESGFCTDGVCCNARCHEDCKSCNEAGGTAGACENRGAGLMPQSGHDGTCAMQPASTCGKSGKCDGAGGCQLYDNTTQCKAGTCDPTPLMGRAPSKCDGLGACIDSPLISCGPFKCNSTNTGCITTCANSNDCVAPNACNGGSCGPKPNGGMCSSGTECQSNNCIDGFCCNSTCTGQCEACDVPGQQGTCSQVASGQPHGSRTACAGTAPCRGSCSTSRTACTFPGSGTSCRNASCTGGPAAPIRTLAAGCDGAGNCPNMTQSCGAYTCNAGGTDCNSTCSGDPQCSTSGWCSGTSCVAKGANGAACSSANQCTSNICVDGRCCNSTCTGQCEACDNAGNLGVCSQVTGAPHTGRPACMGTGTCAAACSTSRTACTFPGGTVQCSSQSCTGSTRTNAAFCNGAGGCNTPTTTSCGNYLCSGTNCGTSCSGDASCVSTAYCNAGSACAARKANGGTCNNAAGADCLVAGCRVCTSNNCVDGYCCNSACGGVCDRCNSTPGTCTLIPDNQPGDPGCGVYLCNGVSAACPTTCATTADCVAGYSCSGGACVGTCFAAGTPVKTPDGLRAIETFAKGDLVLAFDTRTGRTEPRQVLAVEKRQSTALVSIAFGDAPAIVTTPEHHFWVEGSGWVRAAELGLDDRLLAPGGEWMRVRSLLTQWRALSAGPVEVYNLVVAELDNFFVGEAGALVHSCDYMAFSPLTRDALRR
jgi:hypothetical protein